MQFMPELCALLKAIQKAHSELQALLFDIEQYNPT